jgi:integrase
MPRLTTAGIERYRPTRKRREIRDSTFRGLYLIVQPTGAKAFAMRFCRPDGTAAKLTLGPYDDSGVKLRDEPVIGQPLTLQAAHELAAKIHRQRALGVDVVAEHIANKHQHRTKTKQNAATTYPALLRQYIAEHAQPNTRRWRQAARLLGLNYPSDGGEPTVMPKGLCERWATKPVADIDNGDIYTVVDETRRLGAPGLVRAKPVVLSEAMGRAMHGALSPFFNWLVRHRHITTNPCTGVHRPNEPKHKRERVLTESEITSFWNACDNEKVGEPVGQLLKLLLLTGARRDEVRCMRYGELSDHGATWTIPAARTKNRKTHILPLPKLAQDILASVKRISGSDFVFTINGKVPLRFNSFRKHTLDKVMKPTEPWVIHDLRRTAASGMQRLRPSVRNEVIERVLNHVSGSFRGVAGIYQRDPMTPDVRDALERWAAHVESIVTGKPAEDKKVVNFARKRGRK